MNRAPTPLHLPHANPWRPCLSSARVLSRSEAVPLHRLLLECQRVRPRHRGFLGGPPRQCDEVSHGGLTHRVAPALTFGISFGVRRQTGPRGLCQANVRV